MFDTLTQDFKFAVRSLGRAPGFAAAAILTLALAIGANAAMFTLLDAAMFKPLNVPAPGDLVPCTSNHVRGIRMPQVAPGGICVSRIRASRACDMRSGLAGRWRR